MRQLRSCCCCFFGNNVWVTPVAFLLNKKKDSFAGAKSDHIKEGGGSKRLPPAAHARNNKSTGVTGALCYICEIRTNTPAPGCTGSTECSNKGTGVTGALLYIYIHPRITLASCWPPPVPSENLLLNRGYGGHRDVVFNKQGTHYF